MAYNPSFFFSHGGPTFMYLDKDAMGGDLGAFKAIRKIGSEIVETLKPLFIVCVSAHYEATGRNSVEIAVPKKLTSAAAGENELIYDFYGFPSHMYKEEFHTQGPRAVAQQVQAAVAGAGFDAKLVERGIDHGVWVPFKVAFGDSLAIPLIQVLLVGDVDDFGKQEALGRALRELTRTDGANGMVVTSGMSVHNLRDLGRAFSSPNTPMPYVKPFNTELTGILKQLREDRSKAWTALERTPLLRRAHPTLEHLMPVVVSLGYAGDGSIREVYSSASLSLGWNVYRVAAQ